MTEQEYIELLRLHGKDAVAKARKDEIANCKYCQEIKERGGFGPSHFASRNCQSGGRNHCTCDTCF
jgi:hypothetical protein